MVMRIGVISDTHGYLPPDIHRAFRGVALIIHAGDIGGDEIIAELETIASVVAVRGNTDTDSPLPPERYFKLLGVSIFLCHPPPIELPEPPPDVVIHGHTHNAHIEEREGVLWLNPGSAGRPRFGEGGHTVGILTLRDGVASAEIVLLETGD